jgi:hypothetical protein
MLLKRSADPVGGIEETACVLIDWAMDHHGAWFRVLER